MNPRLRAVARTLVLTANTPIAKARLRRTLRAAERPIKLEIGGITPRPGWVITNVNAVTKLYLDATRRWPLEDGSVSFVYADNVVEHITLEAGRAMFAEAFRCMRPGGVIRLVTPDIRSHVELYLAGKSSVSNDVARVYRDFGLTVEHPVDLIRIPIGQFGHHVGYIYDYATLADELVRAGFKDPVQGAVGSSSHPELDALDQRADEGGAQLVVEATR